LKKTIITFLIILLTMTSGLNIVSAENEAENNTVTSIQTSEEEKKLKMKRTEPETLSAQAKMEIIISALMTDIMDIV